MDKYPFLVNTFSVSWYAFNFIGALYPGRKSVRMLPSSMSFGVDSMESFLLNVME